MIHVADLTLPFGGVPLGPGSRELQPAPMDLPYVGGYILGLLLLTFVLFQMRDV
jgi:hypothetical protein